MQEVLLLALVPWNGRVNAFDFPWSGENCWIDAPYKAISWVWRALRGQHAVVTVLVPILESSACWHRSSLTDDIWLSLWWIGCGFLGVIRTSSLEGRHRVARSCPPTGLLWPSGRISRRKKGVVVGSSLREIVVFKAVVALAGTILGIGKNRVTSLGSASLDGNREDPGEVTMAARVQHSAMAHVAGSTSKGYVWPWNAFVKWCGERLSERCPLPTSNFTVELYLQSVAMGRSPSPL